MIDLSVRGKGRVWIGSIAGTLFCVLAAVIVDTQNFATMTPGAVSRALMVDIWLPTILAGPLLFVLLRQARSLAIARDEMAALAMRDGLTGERHAKSEHALIGVSPFEHVRSLRQGCITQR